MILIRKIKIGLVLIFSTLFLTSCGQKIIYDSEGDTLHGKVIVFKIPMVYAQNLKLGVLSKEEHKYNRYLMMKYFSDFLYDHNYEGGKKQNTLIKEGMRFTVKKSFRIIPWGLMTAFSAESRVLVLEDESGLLFTISYSMVQDNGRILESN